MDWNIITCKIISFHFLKQLLVVVCHLLLQTGLLDLWFSNSVLEGRKSIWLLLKIISICDPSAFLSLPTPEIQMELKENNLFKNLLWPIDSVHQFNPVVLTQSLSPASTWLSLEKFEEFSGCGLWKFGLPPGQGQRLCKTYAMLRAAPHTHKERILQPQCP